MIPAGLGPWNVQDRALSAVGREVVPARLPAVEDRLMLVVVVGPPEDDRVLPPDQGLVPLETGPEKGPLEAGVEGARRAGQVDRGASRKMREGGNEGSSREILGLLRRQRIVLDLQGQSCPRRPPRTAGP